MSYHVWSIFCNKCGKEPEIKEVYVNQDGYLLLESYCTVCQADVVGEQVHIMDLMDACQTADKEKA